MTTSPLKYTPLEEIPEDTGSSFFAEILAPLNEIGNALNHLEEWVEPEKPQVPITLITDTCQIRHEPLGVVLIIAPWNFAIQLLLVPLIGALAAGNAVILK
ncbi:hypothetical protein HDU76_009403, partial [Blyttiomyces sp. JEL0837]